MEAVRNLLPPILVALLSAFALAYRETPRPEKVGPPKVLAEDTTDWSGWYWCEGKLPEGKTYTATVKLSLAPGGGYWYVWTNDLTQFVGSALRKGSILTVGWRPRGKEQLGVGVTLMFRRGPDFVGEWVSGDSQPLPETWTPLHPPKGN